MSPREFIESRKRPRRAIPYADAIAWLATNDDCSDIWPEFDSEAPPLISWHLVADIYGRETAQVIHDIRKHLEASNHV